VTKIPRWSLQAQILAVAALAVALAYVGSYYRLSRRGMREAKLYGIPGFLYVPVEEVIARPHDLPAQPALSPLCPSELDRSTSLQGRISGMVHHVGTQRMIDARGQ
jgi:hypothetical protein